MRYFAGIDLAARSSQVCVIDDDQQVLVNQKVPNDLTSIEEVLRPWLGKVEAVVEASFNWYWLVDGLEDLQVPTTLAHPLRLKAITDAKVKTDKRDARWLARLLRGGLIPEAHICPRYQREIRDLVRLRFHLASRHGDALRRSRQVLTNGGHHSLTVTAIRNLAVDQLDLTIGAATACLVYQSQQEHLTSCIAILDQQIATRIKAIPALHRAVRAVTAIPGFGPVNAPTIVLESGDITRFANHRAYASYARLAPGLSQSGESERQGRKGRCGNAHLKRAYTNAAMVAGRWSPAIAAFRDRHRQRRSSHRARNIITNNIIAHKLATAVYQMLTNGVAWNERKCFPLDCPSSPGS